VDVEVRPIAPDELTPLLQTQAQGFGVRLTESDAEAERKIFELGTPLAAFDGKEIVGGLAACPLELTVPGNVLQTTGVVSAAVVPTRRRRGILRSLLVAHLEEARDAGQAASLLWASEAAIYGRFGYGMASMNCRFEIGREHTAFARRHVPGGRIELITYDEALKAFPVVYEALRLAQPGMIGRNRAWWEYRFYQEEHDPPKGDRFFAIHESAEGVEGYAYYFIEHEWQEATPRGRLRVEELLTTSPEATADLWRYLFDMDLVATIQAVERPIDDPVFHLLQEPRRLRWTVGDGLWARLVDVPAALAARRYRTPGEIVIGVADPVCPWNEGRFLLQGGTDGAVCGETEEEPEIVLDAGTLGALFLGGTGVRSLSRAGRVAGSPEALARADIMFRWDPAPWCAAVF
jgi:predicted acetyltransferase